MTDPLTRLTEERPDDSGLFDDDTLLQIIAERFEHGDAVSRRDARWLMFTIRRLQDELAAEKERNRVLVEALENVRLHAVGYCGEGATPQCWASVRDVVDAALEAGKEK